MKKHILIIIYLVTNIFSMHCSPLSNDTIELPRFSADSINSLIRKQQNEKYEKKFMQRSNTDMNDNLLNVSDYTPPTPEVAGMNLYGNIPVNEYTGTPDISIPLYTLKSGQIELPITLSYHASGIKVAQEATWVGLGWNLLAGGCVTLNAVGNVDACSANYPSWEEWEKIGRAHV